jgi:hypothetical protein
MDNKEFKIELEFRTKLFISDLISFLKKVTYDHVDVLILNRLIKTCLKFGSSYRRANMSSKEGFLVNLAEALDYIYEVDYLLKLVADTWTLVVEEENRLRRIKLECRELQTIFKALKY